MKQERMADEKRDARQWERFQRRLEQQKAEANRARNGRMGAASAGRRLDPVTGEVIGVLAKRSVPFVRPKAAKSEHGDERALGVLGGLVGMAHLRRGSRTRAKRERRRRSV